MKSRKVFLGAVASLGALIAATRTVQASAGASPDPSPPPAGKPPSESARAVALRMRQFDPKLTDAHVDTIAHGIDDAWALGDRVNPKGKALKNSDEPAPAFSVKA